MARTLEVTSRGRERRRLGGLALAVATLAGCGGDPDAEGPKVTGGPGRAVEIVGDDFSYAPEQVLVEPGRNRGRGVEIRLRNRGALAHNIKVFQGTREVGGTPTFTGGMVRSTVLRLRPGEYRFVCTVGDHAERGMVGRLTVR